MELPKEALQLLTVSGFDAEFFRHLADSKTHEEAYNRTEEEYIKYFKRSKYKSFDSYRKGRDRRLKGNY